MLHLRTMTEHDLPFLLRLVEQAGWNQTLADCRRFLDLEPHGCFVAELDGQPAGTTTTCRFGPVAWIAMVLVDQPLRRRGIGSRLFTHALSYLDHHPVRTVRLDATAQGRPLYERCGFTVDYELDRFEGRAGEGGPGEPAEPAAAGQLAAMQQLDRQITGTDRTRLIERLFHENPGSAHLVRQGEDVIGYALHRPGRRATLIGPAVAVSPAAGHQLLDKVISRCPQEHVFVDIPCDNPDATRWAAARGLTVQRRFSRMSRGETVRDRPEHIWASSGPELG